MRLISKFILILSLSVHGFIPKDLHEKFRKSKNIDELLRNLEVIYHPELTNEHVQKPRPSKTTSLQIKMGRVMSQGNFVDITENGKPNDGLIDSYTLQHLHGLRNITQGSDTCKLQSVCVAVPQISDDPLIAVFPKCFEVNQCVGSCCDAIETCHPHTIHAVQKPILVMRYIGNDRWMVNATRTITMDEHSACSCFECGSNTPSCPPGFVVGRSCKCECANKDERNHCVGHEIWDPETCKCECNIECNNENESLNRRKCMCHEKRKHNHNHHHKHENHQRIDYNQRIANIPKLKIGRIGV